MPSTRSALLPTLLLISQNSTLQPAKLRKEEQPPRQLVTFTPLPFFRPQLTSSSPPSCFSFPAGSLPPQNRRRHDRPGPEALPLLPSVLQLPPGSLLQEDHRDVWIRSVRVVLSFSFLFFIAVLELIIIIINLTLLLFRHGSSHEHWS